MSAGRNNGTDGDCHADSTGRLATLEPGALKTLRAERPDVYRYVQSLHEALWAFASVAEPGTGGNLSEVVPRTLAKARALRAAAKPEAKATTKPCDSCGETGYALLDVNGFVADDTPCAACDGEGRVRP